MLVIYFGFILLVAFAKPLLAMKIGGGVTSLGILLGLGVIISAFVLTGIYVYRANSYFDQHTRNLTREHHVMRRLLDHRGARPFSWPIPFYPLPSQPVRTSARSRSSP